MDYKNLDVFVLTYNRAEYLRVMLESLCNQTVKGFTIKVLNNCSTDNTLEVIEELRGKYPDRNIEVITNKKNLGNYGNFRRSQELASNEYTAVFHDDDAIHPEYIATAMKILDINKDVILFSSYQDAMWNVSNNNYPLLVKDYYKYNYKCGDNIYKMILTERPVFAANIYKTESYKKVKYKPERYGKFHDIIFMFELSKLGSIIVLKDKAIRYRLHAEMDSYKLETGPFAEEIKNIIVEIYKLSENHSLLFKFLLNNFAKFLYNFCFLEKTISWKNFQKQLRKEDIFTKLDLFLINNCFVKIYFGKILKIQKKVLKKARIKYKYRF